MVHLRGSASVMPPEGAPEHGDFNWVNTGILDRYRGRGLTKTVEQLTGGLEVATKFQHAAINYQHARQELLYVRELAKLLPSRLEKARSRLDLEIAEIEFGPVRPGSKLSARECRP